MSDRELLELAAKAAELVNYVYLCTDQGNYECMAFDEGGRHSEYWSPLTDDADALRLAVKLGLVVAPSPIHSEVLVGVVVNEEGLNIREAYKADACAATRRAIVRAAAEIGRAMP